MPLAARSTRISSGRGSPSEPPLRRRRSSKQSKPGRRRQLVSGCFRMDCFAPSNRGCIPPSFVSGDAPESIQILSSVWPVIQQNCGTETGSRRMDVSRMKLPVWCIEVEREVIERTRALLLTDRRRSRRRPTAVGRGGDFVSTGSSLAVPASSGALLLRRKMGTASENRDGHSVASGTAGSRRRG